MKAKLNPFKASLMRYAYKSFEVGLNLLLLVVMDLDLKDEANLKLFQKVNKLFENTKAGLDEINEITENVPS